MYNLKIIIGSTREGRKGHIVGEWVYNFARKYKEFNTELLDLKEINLPLMDEPNHPRLMQYTKQHTKDWSKKVAEADAYIMVTAEYNFSVPPSVTNALDYVYNEWNYKPMAIVSYGGISAGLRCAQMLKQTITALKMMPMVESVNIPFFTKHIDDTEKFIPIEAQEKSADAMMKELLKWTKAMKLMREEN